MELIELKNSEGLKFSIERILSVNSDINKYRILQVIKKYIEENYTPRSDWKAGDIIANSVEKHVIEDIVLCALIRVNDSLTEYMAIPALEYLGFKVVPLPEITPETIALKFDVDVETVKLLLKKIQ